MTTTSFCRASEGRLTYSASVSELAWLITLRTYIIALARIEIDGLFEVTADALSVSWKPGTTAERYSREWRLSRPDIAEHRWFGRTGFVKPGDVTTLAWDPEREDFVESAASGGVVVPFVIDLDQRVVAYQLRAGVVRQNTFTGALQSLLNVEATYDWIVEPLFTPKTFDAWRQSVNRVTRFTFRLDQPNPNWVDRERVEGIVGDLEAAVARLSGKAADSGSINTEASLFRQMLDHALRGYGHARLEGHDPSDLASEWRSTQEGGIVPATAPIDADTDNVEAPAEALLEGLRRLSGRMGLTPDGDQADADEPF